MHQHLNPALQIVSEGVQPGAPFDIRRELGDH
jgi:hypothetical protein